MSQQFVISQRASPFSAFWLCALVRTINSIFGIFFCFTESDFYHSLNWHHGNRSGYTTLLHYIVRNDRNDRPLHVVDFPKRTLFPLKCCLITFSLCQALGVYLNSTSTGRLQGHPSLYRFGHRLPHIGVGFGDLDSQTLMENNCVQENMFSKLFCRARPKMFTSIHRFRPVPTAHHEFEPFLTLHPISFCPSRLPTFPEPASELPRRGELHLSLFPNFPLNINSNSNNIIACARSTPSRHGRCIHQYATVSVNERETCHFRKMPEVNPLPEVSVLVPHD